MATGALGAERPLVPSVPGLPWPQPASIMATTAATASAGALNHLLFTGDPFQVAGIAVAIHMG